MICNIEAANELVPTVARLHVRHPDVPVVVRNNSAWIVDVKCGDHGKIAAPVIVRVRKLAMIFIPRNRLGLVSVCQAGRNLLESNIQREVAGCHHVEDEIVVLRAVNIRNHMKIVVHVCKALNGEAFDDQRNIDRVGHIDGLEVCTVLCVEHVAGAEQRHAVSTIVVESATVPSEDLLVVAAVGP